MNFLKKLQGWWNPPENIDLEKANEFQKQHLPTLWLLGKTGAGKSSLIKALTGESTVKVGNGFMPCTMTSQVYDFPQEQPIFRFLDTRGLGESNYEPAADIAEIENDAYALVVMIRIDEIEQSDVLQALSEIKKNKTVKNVFVLYTASLTISKEDRANAVYYFNQSIEKYWGASIPSLMVDFEEGSFWGRESLEGKLAEFLPTVAIFMDEELNSGAESRNFLKLRSEVLWYSGIASGTDVIPGVGLVSVPTIQGKLLHSLANQYGIEWSKRIFMELVGTLGSSLAVQYTGSLVGRQLAKLIPVYGQTVGTTVSVAISFASTYAIGRAAAYYFYKKQRGEEVSQSEMQALYKEAFKKAKKTKDE